MTNMPGISPIILVYCRFYGELSDFLPPYKRNKTFPHALKGGPSVKDALESMGVPHTEIDVILVNRRPVGFSARVAHGDKIAVYPSGSSKRSQHVRHLKKAFPYRARFVVDSHLGKLARSLRLLGFDCVYRKIFPDQQIVQIGAREKRIILTRDLGLLKNKIIRYGRWVRATDPPQQLKEIIREYGLAGRVRPLSLCLECNGKIRRVAKKRIEKRLPPKTKEYYQTFYQCADCGKVYWKGAHYQRLLDLINRARRVKTPGKTLRGKRRGK